MLLYSSPVLHHDLGLRRELCKRHLLVTFVCDLIDHVKYVITFRRFIEIKMLKFTYEVQLELDIPRGSLLEVNPTPVGPNIVAGELRREINHL